jgi:hypothetical protein
MIGFRTRGRRAIEISGTDLELEVLADNLTDLAEGPGEWVAVSGDQMRWPDDARSVLNTVIFRRSTGRGSLEAAGDAMVELCMPLPLLQRLRDMIREVSDGVASPNKGAMDLHDDALEIQVRCTGAEPA